MSSPLERLLQEQYQGGEAVFPGRFTMHREKALEKIARFGLPYPEAWILKLAQAAKVLDSHYLDIKQSRSETKIGMDPRQCWTNDEFERSFFDPSPCADEGLDLLRAGLWSVGIGYHRPFRLRLPGQPAALYWDGFGLARVEGATGPRLSIDISHRTVSEGKGLPLLREVQAVLYNASLLKVIGASLFTLPLELRVDSRRVDGYQFSATHGFSARNHPLALHWLQVPGQAPLEIPPATETGLRVAQPAQQELQKLSAAFRTTIPPNVKPTAAVLVSAHADLVSSGKNSNWEAFPTVSCLSWIRRGVVVQQEEFAMTKTTVSLNVLANADHIRTDLTGFGLNEDELATLRQAVCLQVSSVLSSASYDLSLIDWDWHRTKMKAAGGVAFTGLAVGAFSPLGFLAAAAGGFSMLMMANGLAKIDRALERGRDQLVQQWLEAYPLS